MKTVAKPWIKASLLVLVPVVLGVRAFGQWQVGEQVFSPPSRGGIYFSMRLLYLGPNSPPMPGVPVPGLAVYYLGTFYGTTNAFVYDDRELAGGFSASSGPPMPGEGGGGSASETNAFPYAAYDHGTNLFLIIGPTNNHRAWLVATNVHYPLLYQLESCTGLAATNSWEPGEVVMPTNGAVKVECNDVRTDNPLQRFYRVKVFDPSVAPMCVAIHDSGLTRSLGLSSTNWAYGVLPESVREALRSDGTPFVTIGDSGLRNGILLNGDSPRFPILICLASEVITDDEIAPLLNYVTNGGFVLIGSSSFTRHADGTFRTTPVIWPEMGLSCSAGSGNWVEDYWFTNCLPDDRLVQDLPADTWLIYRLPQSGREINWGTCEDSHNFIRPDQHWLAEATDAVVLANYWHYGLKPLLAKKNYGAGTFIYNAGLQPLIANGGYGAGMYAYMMFRRAIEWAFESAHRPIAKLSPWPYTNNAAFMVRHDLENFTVEFQNADKSAEFEYQRGVKGDYYICTGAATNVGVDTGAVIAALNSAVTSFGATIGPHNGGLPNPRRSETGACAASVYDYIYYHWGPDEALDVTNGYNIAFNSLSASFSQIDTWVGTQSPRTWVAPYFNATREDSFRIQEQLGVEITGDQKLTPFPHWTVSTETDGKRYPLLSEPTSEWFVGMLLAQAIGVTAGNSNGFGLHTTNTLHYAVDFYYNNGFLVNFYSHALSVTNGGSDPTDGAGLTAEYITYCTNTLVHSNFWSANARSLYDWWVKRSPVRIAASISTNSGHPVADISISGSIDTNTAIEVLDPGSGPLSVVHVRTNGTEAGTDVYRVVNNLVKVRAGTTATSVQVEYAPSPKPPKPPKPQEDYFAVTNANWLAVGAPGVLANDTQTNWPFLIATNGSTPAHGNAELNSNGGFNYTNSGVVGIDCFTYEARDTTNHYGRAAVNLLVFTNAGPFRDDFARCSTNPTVWPWSQAYGAWSLGSGTLQGSAGGYNYCYFGSNWNNYSVQASINVASGSWGGGIGGRLNPADGRHYALWIYPESSWSGTTNKLLLVKFWDWLDWGYNGTQYLTMAQMDLPSPVGNTWHPVGLSFTNHQIEVFYDGLSVTNVMDNDSDTNHPYSSYGTGGVSFDLYGGAMSVSNLIVTPYPN